MDSSAEVGRYRTELAACVRRQDPEAYRRFVASWRDLIQKGAADRLVAMDDDALSIRLARMALDDPDLADIHADARATLAGFGAEARQVGSDAARPPSRRSGVVRLRRPRPKPQG